LRTVERQEVTASPNRLAGYVAGVAFLVLGVLGLVVTHDVGFADPHGQSVLVFELNPMQSLLHLGLGALLLEGARHPLLWARFANTMAGGILVAVGLVGLALAGGSQADFLALNQADNLLHIAAGVMLLAVSETKR
jgi:hypothetical protein